MTTKPSARHSGTAKKPSQAPLLEGRRFLSVLETSRILNCNIHSLYLGIADGTISATKIPHVGIRIDYRKLAEKLGAAD